MKKIILYSLTTASLATAATLYLCHKQNVSNSQPPVISEKHITPEKQPQLEPILVKPNVEYIYIEVEKVKEVYIDRPIFVKPERNWDREMLNGIKFFEGFRSESYYCCANVKTIGYGCTDKNIVALGSISEYKASNVLQAELNEVRDNVRQAVKVDLTEYQLNALTSFTFNCGLSNLKTLINGPGRLNSGNYESVSKIMPKYRLAAGKVKEGLVKRRAWEVSLFNGNPSL